jgi:hypothetical protein
VLGDVHEVLAVLEEYVRYVLLIAIVVGLTYSAQLPFLFLSNPLCLPWSKFYQILLVINLLGVEDDLVRFMLLDEASVDSCGRKCQNRYRRKLHFVQIVIRMWYGNVCEAINMATQASSSPLLWGKLMQVPRYGPGSTQQAFELQRTKLHRRYHIDKENMTMLENVDLLILGI